MDGPEESVSFKVGAYEGESGGDYGCLVRDFKTTTTCS